MVKLPVWSQPDNSDKPPVALQPFPAMKPLRPSTLSRTLALIPPAVALLAPPANAATNTFLKMENVAGESIDANHVDWIDLFSWSFGATNSPLAGNPSSTTSAASLFTFTKALDKSSPALFLGCAQGTIYPTVTLELVKSTTSFMFYRITLNNVLISSINTTGHNFDDKPGETVSLNFQKIKIEYFYPDASGVTTAAPAVTWNFATHSKD
jgi:type VI secretion system secreted protein Hcp